MLRNAFPVRNQSCPDGLVKLLTPDERAGSIGLSQLPERPVQEINGRLSLASNSGIGGCRAIRLNVDVSTVRGRLGHLRRHLVFQQLLELLPIQDFALDELLSHQISLSR